MELEDDEPSETRLPHSEWTQVRSEDEDNNNTDEYALQTIKHKTERLLEECRNPNRVSVVRMLLEEGESLDIHSISDGSYPLHKAIESGSIDMLITLLEHCSQDYIDITRDDLKTPLMLGCVLKNIPAVKILLERGASTDVKDRDGVGCLHYKQTLESTEIVTSLLQYGADVDIQKERGSLTPLTCACLYQYEETVNILLEHGANPDGSMSECTHTPLTAASKCGNMSILCILLESGASFDMPTEDGSTPLLIACKENQTEIAFKLISSGANIDTYARDGGTPVWYAVHTRNTELLQFLIINGVDVNRPRRDFSEEHIGMEITPLSIAVGHGQLEIVKLLIDNNADVNYRSKITMPALGWAAKMDHSHVIEYIVKLAQTKKTIENFSEALILAAQNKNRYIGGLLLQALGGKERALELAQFGGNNIIKEAIVSLTNRQTQPVESSSRPIISESSQVSIGMGDMVQNVGYEGILRERAARSECLNDFVQFCIQAYLKGRSPDVLLVRVSNSPHASIKNFFFVYFRNSEFIRSVSLFIEFVMNSPPPCEFLFNSEEFTGKAFADVLREMGSLNLMLNVQVALMQFGEVQENPFLTGEGVMELLFGKRFMKEIKSQNLLNPNLAIASPHSLLPLPPPPFIHTDGNSTPSEHTTVSDTTHESLLFATSTTSTRPHNISTSFTGTSQIPSTAVEMSLYNEFTSHNTETVPARGGLPAITVRRLAPKQTIISSNTNTMSVTLPINLHSDSGHENNLSNYLDLPIEQMPLPSTMQSRVDQNLRHSMNQLRIHHEMTSEDQQSFPRVTDTSGLAYSYSSSVMSTNSLANPLQTTTQYRHEIDTSDSDEEYTPQTEYITPNANTVPFVGSRVNRPRVPVRSINVQSAGYSIPPNVPPVQSQMEFYTSEVNPYTNSIGAKPFSVTPHSHRTYSDTVSDYRRSRRPKTEHTVSNLSLPMYSRPPPMQYSHVYTENQPSLSVQKAPRSYEEFRPSSLKHKSGIRQSEGWYEHQMLPSPGPSSFPITKRSSYRHLRDSSEHTFYRRQLESGNSLMQQSSTLGIKSKSHPGLYVHDELKDRNVLVKQSFSDPRVIRHMSTPKATVKSRIPIAVRRKTRSDPKMESSVHRYEEQQTLQSNQRTSDMLLKIEQHSRLIEQQQETLDELKAQSSAIMKILQSMKRN